MYTLTVLSIKFFSHMVNFETTNHNNPLTRKIPKVFLVSHYDCKDHQQKTLHKYAINQVKQCDSEQQKLEPTNVIATFFSKTHKNCFLKTKFFVLIIQTESKKGMIMIHFTKDRLKNY